MANDWLKEQHPIYVRKQAEWAINERRFRGGMDILAELRRFDWEVGPSLVVNGDRSNEHAIQMAVEQKLLDARAKDGLPFNRTHYASRQGEATYPTFCESFAGLLMGHLMAKAPEQDDALDFGTLGTVQRLGEVPSEAELVYYNADGVGNTGSQWNPFWNKVGKLAMATGHRWNMVEASRIRPQNRRDLIKGQRPYLISYSPLQVPNWDEQDGELQMAIVGFQYRAPRLVHGALEGNAYANGYRLMTAAGWKGFDQGDQKYSTGGWWDFDKDGNLMGDRTGDWSMTDGQIPMWFHPYERDDRDLSRSGLFEMGQAAVAYMNGDSAWGFDVWDAACSINFILGVSEDAFNLAMSKLADGSRYVPVPGNVQGTVQPSMKDGSLGAVTADVFDKRLARLLTTLREIASRESSGGPDASGLSKQMGFLDAKSPRLSNIANEMETSQNTAIYFLEKRFGHASPTGAVRWPRDFDLASIMDAIGAWLDLQVKAGVTNPTLTARAMVKGAAEAGLLTDDDEIETIEQEYVAEIAGNATTKAQDAAMLKGFLPGTNQLAPPADGNPPPPPKPGDILPPVPPTKQTQAAA